MAHRLRGVSSITADASQKHLESLPTILAPRQILAPRHRRVNGLALRGRPGEGSEDNTPSVGWLLEASRAHFGTERTLRPPGVRASIRAPLECTAPRRD